MKLTFILLFISFMQVSATLYSQNDRVSIQVKGGLIEDVFRLIERQSNYVFVYNHEQVPNQYPRREKSLFLDGLSPGYAGSDGRSGTCGECLV